MSNTIFFYVTKKKDYSNEALFKKISKYCDPEPVIAKTEDGAIVDIDCNAEVPERLRRTVINEVDFTTPALFRNGTLWFHGNAVSDDDIFLLFKSMEDK